MSNIQLSNNKNRIYNAVFLLALLCAIAVGYGHTLNSPFLFDDEPNIVQNPYIRIDNLSFASLGKVFSPDQPSYTRPLANLSFALNYLADGYKPLGFHLVNIFIHILTSIVVFRLCSFYFLKTGFSGKDSVKLAAFAALLWALNPLQINAVTYIVQRMTSLCTLLFSTSLLAYVHARRLQLSDDDKRGRFRAAVSLLVSLIFWILAMMTKEIAAIMPVIILLHEFFFFRGQSAKTYKNVFRAFLYSAVFFLPLLLYMVWFRAELWHSIIGGYASRDFTLGERLLTEGRVVVRYMSLFILPLPSRMTLYYNYQISSSLIEPVSTLLSFLLLLCLIIFSFGWAKKYRLLSFGLLWTLSCLVIESTFLPLKLIFEHRFYLPSIGFSIALVALSSLFFNSLFKNKRVFNVFWVAVLCLMTAMTYMRNQDWRSELSFNLDAVKKTPNLVDAVNNLAVAYIGAGEAGKGKAALDRALQLNADNVVVLSNLVMFAIDHKMSALTEDYLSKLKMSIKEGHLRCNQGTSILLASEILFKHGRFADVIYLLESLKTCRAKNSAIYYDNLALSYARTGNHRKAIENFNKALERDPGNPYYLFSLVRQYLFNRDSKNALATLEKLNNTPVPDELKPPVDKLRKYLLDRSL